MSLAQKLVASFGLIGLILLAGISYILIDFSSVERLGSKVITEQQPVSQMAHTALDAVNSATNNLHTFLLTSEKKYYQEFTHNQQELRTALDMLLESAKTPELELNSEQLVRSKELIAVISRQAEELNRLSGNYEENHPSIALASGTLNPLALEYLGYINELIDEVSEMEATSANLHALNLLSNIRHTWTQMMSYLRIALATQTAIDLKNVEAYAEVNHTLTDELLSLKIDIGMVGLHELDVLRNRYQTYLENVIEQFDSNIWRQDAHLMTTIIMPSFNELKFYIESITQKQTLIHQKTSTVLAKRLEHAGYIYITIMLIAAAVAFFISIAFIRLFNQALSGLTAAAQDVAEGNLDARVQLDSHDELGRLASCFNNMLDKIKTSHNDLEVAKTQAEEANTSKSIFLTRMSHELRTPLNGILGFAQLMEMQFKQGISNSDLEDHKTNLQHILKAGWHQLQLVDELLDLSCIESNMLKVELAPTHIGPIIEECINTVTPSANNRKLQLTYSIAECDRAVVNIDSMRLKQVILNLLTNAIKFNCIRGSIHVACDIITESVIRISVTDTGPGISKTNQEELFIPFNRLDADKKAIEGTGVGLALCKNIVTLMNGKIGIESTPGKGSCFWIEFPCDVSVAPEVVMNKIQTSSYKDHPVIVYIEDDDANAQLMKRIMAMHHPEVEFLHSNTAEIGMRLIRERAPDIIFMDINLPGMSGSEARKMIAADPNSAHMPVIAVSADAMQQSINARLQEGFIEYITKPLDVKQIVELTDNLLKKNIAPKHMGVEGSSEGK